MLPTAIGAVVEGLSMDFQIPLSGQRSPVRAVVPIGFLAIDIPLCQYDNVKIYRTSMERNYFMTFSYGQTGRSRGLIPPLGKSRSSDVICE